MRKFLLFLGVISLIVAAGAIALFRPLGPPSADAPPELAAPDAYVTHAVVRTVPGTITELRAWMEDNPLVSYLSATDDIPTLTDTNPLRGTFPDEGATRRVVLEDGNYAVERVLENTYPTRFAYQVWNFTTPTARIVDHAYADQVFEDTEDGARMTWTYRMTPKIGLLRTPLQGFLTDQFGPYMAQGMNAMLDAYEASRAQ